MTKVFNHWTLLHFKYSVIPIYLFIFSHVDEFMHYLFNSIFTCGYVQIYIAAIQYFLTILQYVYINIYIYTSICLPFVPQNKWPIPNFKGINTFNQQECIKLIHCVSKNIYNVKPFYYLSCNIVYIFWLTLLCIADAIPFGGSCFI